MKSICRLSLVIVIFTFTAGGYPISAFPGGSLRQYAIAPGPERFVRTELYFGLGRKNGSEVSDAEWDRFLSSEVTPRFPEGFTTLYAVGQFRSASGMIIRENSRVLILLYPKKIRKIVDSRINDIRAAYIRLFDQESVLRVDFRRSVEVDF